MPGFVFIGTDSKTYGYNADGQPTALGVGTTGLSSIAAADYKADAWSNVASRSVTYTPHIPNLGSSSSSSLSGGYVGVAESNNSLHSHAGIGASIHGRWVEPVQTVAVSKPQPVVQKQVFVPKPVVTVAKIESVVKKHIPCPPTPITNAEIKAKPIANDIAVTQKKGHKKVFKLENTVVTHEVMYELSNALMRISFDLDVMSFKNTKLSNFGVFGIFSNVTRGTFHNVVYLDISNTDSNDIVLSLMSKLLIDGKMDATEVINLSGNKITDNGVKAIGEALKTGKVNNLKYLDVSGNNITETGEDFFIKALNNPIVHRLAILLKDLGQNLRIQSGIKEDVVAELHSILKSANDRGVDVKNIVVDTSFMTWVKNIKGAVTIAKNGFIKCKWFDDPIGDYAKADLCAKLPDTLGKPLKKIIDIESTVSCFIFAYDQGKTSEFGAQMAITDLHVIGEEYVPDNIE